jgi:signal transduction histidine kinase
LCLSLVSVHAQTPALFNLESGIDNTELHAGVQFYKDAENTLRLKDVSSPHFDNKWTTFQRSTAMSFGFNRSAYWLRFTVRNRTLPNYNNWLFEVAFPPLDSLDIYVPQADGTMRLFHTGDHVPFYKREIRFRTFIVPLQLPDSLPKTVYVRVRTTSAMNLPLYIYTREAAIENGISSVLIFGVVIGIVIVLFLYNLVPYIVSREQIYLRYLIYMTGAVLFVFTFNGFTAQFIFTEGGFLLQYCTLFSMGLSFLGFTILIQELYQTKILVPRLHRILTGIMYFWIMTIVAGLFADYLTVNIVQVMSFLPFTVFLAFVSIKVQIKRKSEKTYYFFVNLALYFGVFTTIITMLSNLGIVSNTALTRSSTQAVIIMDALMFSLALAQRFQILRNEKLQAQEEILHLQRDQNMMLQRAVDERTAELQHRNTDLAALNNEKTELMGIVAHDLKNPIGTVLGLAELVHSGFVEAKETPEIIGQIISTANRMLGLVKNLLDVNQLESGGMQFRFVDFDIAPILESIIEQYQTQAAAKHITLLYSSEAAANPVFADEQAVIQVLDNLISNAVKYSPYGKNVVVSVTPTDATIRISVQDEGQGISPDDMKKLFGKFARLSAQPTGGEHSTGLGLSIVKKMVEAMNGKVWCESEVGRGATFIVELPVALMSH